MSTPSSTVQTTTTIKSTSYSTVTVVATPSAPVVPLPVPSVTTFSTTGTFTIPASTVTVSSETTVPAPASTSVTSGVNTVGGVTTIVETSTTIVCPYATVKPSGSTVTSVIETTTYVCPSAGTYTIAPITTTVTSPTVVIVPTPVTVTPGTYTQPEQTVTVTEKDYTYVCPFATGAPTSSAVSVAPKVTPTPVSIAVSVSVPSVASVASVPSASTPAAAPTGKSLVDTTHYGMTYTPYTSSGACTDQSTIEQDIADIAAKGFKVVRLYSTDCSGLEFVGQAASDHGLKLILGVFISGSGISAAQEQVQQISSWAQWSLVDLIVVGNEAISSGYVTASELASFVSSSASAFKAAGYAGKVTLTEPLDIWQQYGSTLCGVVDIVGANVHPFFNSGVSPLDAGSFTKSQMNILAGICPGKTDVINLETGWPTAGQANGLAIPGIAEQLIALTTMAAEVGENSVFFSYSNDLWKPLGQFDVERSWGCSIVF
jgi:exo-beta-1,3-glucanase (GH17 family)